MKIKYIYFSLLIPFLVSCNEEDLTLTPAGQELDVTFYKTEEQINQALYAAYDPFQHVIWGGNAFMWGSVTSDDAVAGGADNTDQKTFQLADRFVLTPIEDKDKDLLQFWESRWKIVYRSNLILKFADPATELGRKAIAHAYFLKAYAYFELVRMFGGMPIIDKVPNPDDKFPRATVEQTYAAIEGYLKASLESGMPKRKNGVDPDGLATEASVRTLLGKVYVYQKKYAEAIEELEKVANDPEYGLEPNYADVFNPANKHGKESIFEINFTSTDGGTIWDQYVNGNAVYTLVGPRTGEVPIKNVNFSWGWGMNQPTNKLAQAFDAMGDTARKNHSIISSDSIKKMSPTTTFQNELTGWWDLKHIRRIGFFTSATQVAQNTILLRLSDVFLLLAEAYNRKSPADDAKARFYLNKVRARAKLPEYTSESGDVLFDLIKKERQLELCLEGDRYFDLVRWGDAEKELTGDAENVALNGSSYKDGKPGTATKGLFPIPQDEMNKIGIDPTFPQNEGY